MYRLLILFVLVAAICSAQVADPSHPMIQFPDGTLLSPTNPMPVDADVNISNITVEAFPVYQDEAGDPATAEIDSDRNAKVNIASEGIGLIDAIDAIVTTIGDQTTTLVDDLSDILKAIQDQTLTPSATNVTKITLVANTSTLIEDIYASNPNYSQKYTEIKTYDPEQEFWVAFGTAAVIDGNARPCMGTLYVENRIQPMYIIASEAIDIFVTRAAITIQP
jgi:hypothetical protein